MGALSRSAQFRGALADNFFRQRTGTVPGITRQTHARVEMNLRVAGQHAITNQFLRFLHRRGWILVAPDIWSEMITTENNSLVRKIHGRRDFLYQSDKPRGRLSGVSAKLVDLV